MTALGVLCCFFLRCILKDLDRGFAPQSSSSTSDVGSGHSLEDVTRQAIAQFEEKLNTSPISIPEMGVAGPSGVGPESGSDLMVIPSRSTATLSRGRLPSLQSRKRPLPAFAGGSSAAVAPK